MPVQKRDKNMEDTVAGLLADPVVTLSVNKFVRRYLRQFNFDEAEIRSVAQYAIFHAAKKYSTKPSDELRRLAICSVRNTILNTLKAQNRKRRGGSMVPVQITEDPADATGVILADQAPNPEETALMAEARGLTPAQERLLGEISQGRSGMKPQAFFARALKRSRATEADGARLYRTLFY